MPLGKGKIIYKQLTPPSMKNGTSFKSRDEIFVWGRAVTLLVLALHVKHEYCIIMSIIILTHKHHTTITSHFMYTLCD